MPTQALVNKEDQSFLETTRKQTLKTVSAIKEGAQIPEIRIAYPSTVEKLGCNDGDFWIKNGDETKVIGPVLEATIIRIRMQYSYYDEANPDKSYYTNEIDNYNDQFILSQGKIELFRGNFKPDFKKFIYKVAPNLKSNYDQASHIKRKYVLYLEYNKNCYKMYISSASAEPLQEFSKANEDTNTFLYKTKFTTVQKTNKATRYYQLQFEKSTDNDISMYIKVRKQTDDLILKLDEMWEDNLGKGEEGEIREAEIINSKDVTIQDIDDTEPGFYNDSREQAQPKFSTKPTNMFG